MRKPTRVVIGVFLGSLLFGQSALASKSLSQIEYALFKDPYANVEADLRMLVDHGDLVAMRILGDVLATTNTGTPAERLSLYQASFAEGRGEVRALAAMARMMESDSYRRRHYLDFFQRAVSQYPQQRDLQTLSTSLDVFLIYPELFAPRAAADLIQLHRRSCLVNCATELYEAVLAERQGNPAQADILYRQAVLVDDRAVERYYRFLAERQTELFPPFARQLMPQADSMSAASVHLVGVVLDRLADLARADERIDEQRRRQLADAAGIKFEPQASDQVVESEVLRREALAWIDNAAARKWVPAMSTRFYFMTSYPDNFSGAEAFRLIDEIAELDPDRARTLRVSALMVSNWSTLNPKKAHVLIQQMIAEGEPGGYALLGDLYSRGGLDEPDQQRALAIFEDIAKRDSPSAYFSQARIYAGGPAICSDPPRAYALAGAAYELGVERARSLIKELAFELTDDERARAEAMRDDILRELKI